MRQLFRNALAARFWEVRPLLGTMSEELKSKLNDITDFNQWSDRRTRDQVVRLGMMIVLKHERRRQD